MPITGTESAAATVTPASTRVVSMAAYAVALCAWVATIGLPKQTLPAFTWIWLATIAWNVRAPWRSHLAFVRDWWPAAALLTAYLLSRGLADNVGTAVHVAAPAAADRALFGGVLPTAYLQDHLCGQPCDPSFAPALVRRRAHHRVLLPLLRGDHHRSGAVDAEPSRVAAVHAALPVTEPRGPGGVRDHPHRAAVAGRGRGRAAGRGVPAHRSRMVGANHAGFHRDLAALGNPVAAMPSVHFAVACFVAWWTISMLRSPWRWSVLAYPLAMGFALVYDAEHYVVDLVGGLLLTTLVMLAWSRWERWPAADGMPGTEARDG